MQGRSTKRQKEQARAQWQREKEEKRATRRRERAEKTENLPPGEDPDIAGIIPGPQPPLEM